jgi:hypothetical protein
VTSTILQTEFLLQFRKQREDSAILLASNRPHNKDKTKKQRKTEREKNRERLRTSGLTGSSPLTKPEATDSKTEQASPNNTLLQVA